MSTLVEFTFCTAWNTKRPYTEHGQRIAVWRVYVGGKLCSYFMVDLDRGIEYHFRPLDRTDSMEWEVRTWVQECYDFNRDKDRVYPYQFALGSDTFYDLERKAVRDSCTLDFKPWSPLYL